MALRTMEEILENARHAQYAYVLYFLENLLEGADGDTRDEIEMCIRCVDAVYVTGGRATIGPIDGAAE